MKGDGREGIRETKRGCKAEKKGFGGSAGARVTSEWAGDLGEASPQGPEFPHTPFQPRTHPPGSGSGPGPPKAAGGRFGSP